MVEADPARGVRLGLAGLALTTGLAALAGWTALASGSFVAAAAAAHTLAGVWAWLAIQAVERRRRRAAAERLEATRLASLAREGRRPLFDVREAAEEGARALERLQRVGFPLLTLGLAATELALAWALFTRLAPGREAPDGALPLLAALLAGGAFLLLLLGRYSFAMARGGLLLAGAGGRRATSAAFALFLSALAMAAHHHGFHEVRILGYGLAGVAALLGLEALVLLVLDAYRPRRAGEEARPPFDSRLLGLLSAPGDLARSIARAVDYQFGFSLSQTWLYRFLERWIAPLCAFSGLALWALSCLVVVHPHEQALLSRFGRTQATALQPGLHLKLPWPIDRARPIPAARIHTLSTGEHALDDPHEHDLLEAAILWRAGGHDHHHHDEGEGLLLIPRGLSPDEAARGATPVSLLTVAASVQYEVGDLRRFALGVEDPAALLEVLAERELAFLLGGEDLDRLLRERGAHARALADRLDAAARALELGVAVRSAALADMHPPVEVAAAFEAVGVARERSRAQVFAAQAEAVRVRERGASQTERIVAEAETAARSRLLGAASAAQRFAALRGLDGAASELFRATRLLETLREGARGKRKVVLRAGGAATTDLDLQEKVSVEALGLGQEVSAADCPRCGVRIPEDARSCPRCGHEAPAREEELR